MWFGFWIKPVDGICSLESSASTPVLRFSPCQINQPPNLKPLSLPFVPLTNWLTSAKRRLQPERNQ